MIDSHCHINDEMYLSDPTSYVKDAKEEGVFSFLVVGSTLKDSLEAVKIADKFDECYAAVGIHPEEVNKLENDYLEQIKTLAKSKKVIAIGEIGLDYYWEKDEQVREKQKMLFIAQINLANELDLPISIHCRDALEDCLNILKNHKVNRGGVMHCYAGSYEMAGEFIKLGFLLGFGGTTTFKNSVKPKEVVSKIPENSFVLETDAPYLTPVPFRGQPNHSKYLKFVRDEIAKLRGISSEKVDEITTQNFNRVFKK